MNHFWKVFAMVVATCALGMAYFFLSSIQVLLERHSVVSHRRPYPTVQQLVMYLRNPEAEPATIHLKNETKPVVGYLADSDSDFLVLSLASPGDPIETRVLVPWDNVLYVQTRLKPNDKK